MVIGLIVGMVMYVVAFKNKSKRGFAVRFIGAFLGTVLTGIGWFLEIAGIDSPHFCLTLSCQLSPIV